jgi:hypothetical protein
MSAERFHKIIKILFGIVFVSVVIIDIGLI